MQCNAMQCTAVRGGHLHAANLTAMSPPPHPTPPHSIPYLTLCLIVDRLFTLISVMQETVFTDYVYVYFVPKAMPKA